MPKIRLTKILFVISAFVMMTALFLCANISPVSAEASGIDYTKMLTVTESGEGYTYTDGTIVSDGFATLNALVAEILANRVENFNAIIYFDNIATSDYITVSSGPVLFNGSVNYVATEKQPFLRVKNGADAILQGLSIVAKDFSAIYVDRGATLTIESGSLSITDDTEVSYTVLNNKGAIVINSATILNDARLGEYPLGNAIGQDDDGATLVINGGTYRGSNALSIGGGVVTANGGDFVATGRGGSAGGYALHLTNSAVAYISGGYFDSLNDKDRTVRNDGGSITYTEGTVSGKMGTAGQGKITVKDTSISPEKNYILLPDSYGVTYLYSDGITSISNLKLGYLSSSLYGHYAVRWGNVSGGYATTDTNPSLSSFSAGEIRVETDNKYTVTVYLGIEEKGSFSVQYNSMVYATDIDSLVTLNDGYAITSRKISDREVSFPYKVTKDTDVVLSVGLAKPQLGSIEDINGACSGTANVIEAPITEGSGLSYTYSWEKQTMSGWAVVSTERTLEVKDVADSGGYKLTVKVTDGAEEKSASTEFIVKLTKGTYVGITHDGLTGVYDKNKRLSDYVLEEGYFWVDPTVVPTVSTVEYDARYCPDPDNFEPYELKINLILEKAAPVSSIHSTLPSVAYDPNRTLADVELSSGWRWADPTVVPTVKVTSYSALYSPDENYEEYATSIAMYLTKANHTAKENLHLTVKYEPYLTAYSVLAENKGKGIGVGYYFDQFGLSSPCRQVVTSIGEKEYPAYYNSDSDNYNDFDDVNIILRVEKGLSVMEYPEGELDGGVFNNLTLASVRLEDGWRWQNPTELLTVTKTEYALFHNPDSELYEDYSTSVRVVVTKADVPVAERTHPKITGTYANRTLSEYSLNDGWSWIDGTVTPTVDKKEYQAKLDKGKNYNDYIGTVTVDLAKAVIDMSAVIFDDVKKVYDGTPISVECKNLPVGITVSYVGNTKTYAGEYTVTASFGQPDTVNYELIPDMTAKITVEKAVYDMSGIGLNDLTVTYDGEVHNVVCTDLPDGVTVVGYENNGKVNAGRYPVTVTFGQADSDNYELVSKRTVYITIKKATTEFIGERIQHFLYDGEEKFPTVTVNNGEQRLNTTAVAKKEVGEYEIVFFTEESCNYEGTEITVILCINAEYVESGEDGVSAQNNLFVRLYDYVDGIRDSVEISGRVVEGSVTDSSFTAFIVVEGIEQGGEYTILLLLPDSLRGEGIVVEYLLDGEYVMLESVQNGNYLSIKSSYPQGQFRFTSNSYFVTEGSADGLEWWGILLITLGSAALAGGITVGVIFGVKAIKKKKIGSQLNEEEPK